VSRVSPSSVDGWETAPCALLTLRADGTVLEANALLREWAGRTPEELAGLRFSDLLSVGGRIFWETHLSPLLHVDGRVEEVALELRSPTGRTPVLMTAVVQQPDGQVQVALSGARERSRYERELVAARTAAERSAQQVTALQEVTAALSGAVGVDALTDVLLTASTGPLGASAGTLWLSGPGGLEAVGSAGETGAALPEAGVLLHERAPVPDAGRVVVPLHGSAALQGVLSLVAPEGGGDDPLDLEVLTAVGQQAGLALDRAHLYEQSASVAHELQRSLLAGAPPVDGRFSVATVYRPGVEMLEVGGDWYDVFLAEEGVLSVVVGDVVGRGLGAATAMGQLRSAVRAVAGPGVGPARLLSRLDRFVEQVEAAGMATLAYAELDLATGLLRYACAGHPPPVLLPADGEPSLVWDGRSTPLGAFVHPQERSEASLQLSPGDRLLLYTDGLVERRDRSLDEGLELLSQAAAQVAAAPLGEAVRTLTSRLLVDERGRDDVCVLLLSWAANAFERDLSADLSGLAGIRAELGSWLSQRGADEVTRQELVLAASEAVANAAEHGSGRRSAERVTLQARVVARTDGPADVVLQVRDHGRWRTPTASEERGRGLTIIGALVDDVVVEAGEGTTVVLRKQLRRATA
jgi:serine phosphatase RsbU (regulator of sigma subunit)/anti-sigma regulatory factor (Ser/Thr protein kinase)